MDRPSKDCAQPAKTVLIVGAGIGGVATAARLAKAGYRVTVVEKNSFTGGRCSLIHHEGYRFDQGPSLLLLPNLFKETFEDLGTSLPAEGIHLVRCDPNYTVHFPDNTCIKLSTDLSVMRNEISKYEGEAGFFRYLSFLKEAHRHYELSLEHVLKKNFYSIWSMARPQFLKHVLTLHPFESVHDRASRYFRSERLRRVFTFGSMYMGMSPFRAPGTYSLLQYTELVEGIWYPIGGFHRVVEALVDFGKRLGVQYHLCQSVASIILSADGSVATGIVLASGQKLTADIIIINADLIYAYKHLLPPSRYSESLAKKPVSCSSISFYWALNTQLNQLGAHNVFLADNYAASFDDIFERHDIPEEPSFYIHVPSRMDPSAAPEGKDALVVLVPVGHLTEPVKDTKGMSVREDWDTIVSRARTMILQTLSARLNIPVYTLHSFIAHEHINTPITWERKFNLDRGSILGISHSFFNVMAFRPKMRHEGIRGLWFVGASTHPGTGVPICLAGAKLLCEEVLDATGGDVPWFRGETARNGREGGKVGLDYIESLNYYRLTWWKICLLLCISFLWISLRLMGIQQL